MSRLNTKRWKLAGEYDFANDPGAGALGDRLLGVYIPVKALITGFFVIPVINPASGGAATISFGNATEAGVVTNNSLMVAQPFAAFVARVPVAGVNLQAAPLSFLNDTVQVTMTIAGAVLTAGSLAFVVWADDLQK